MKHHCKRAPPSGVLNIGHWPHPGSPCGACQAVILGIFQIDKNLRSLERCQSLEETQRLYEAGDHKAVVRLLRPTLCPSGFDRAKHLEFMTSVPERPAQLLLLQVGVAWDPLRSASCLGRFLRRSGRKCATSAPERQVRRLRGVGTQACRT